MTRKVVARRTPKAITIAVQGDLALVLSEQEAKWVVACIQSLLIDPALGEVVLG